MCAQCWMAAATTTTGAAGIRVFLAARRPPWMTQRRLRALTVSLMVLAVVLSGVRVG